MTPSTCAENVSNADGNAVAPGQAARLVIQAAADEVLDDGVGVGGRPGNADLAGADAGDGPVGDVGAPVVAGGGFGGQGDAVAAGDRSKPVLGLVGDSSDADRVALPLADGQPPVAPPAGLGGSGDERFIPQVPEADLIARRPAGG